MAKNQRAKTDEAVGDAERDKLLADQAVALAEYAAKALVTAEQLRLKGEPVEGLSLNEDERAALAVLPGHSAKLQKKLAQHDADLTVAEVAGITMAVAEAFPEAEPKQQVSLLLVAKKLMDCLQRRIVMPVEPAKAKRPQRRRSN